MLRTHCLCHTSVQHRDDTQPSLPAAQGSTSGVEAGPIQFGQSAEQVALSANVPNNWADMPGMLEFAKLQTSNTQSARYSRCMCVFVSADVNVVLKPGLLLT